jgi:methionyl-tRNA formyltransferase
MRVVALGRTKLLYDSIKYLYNKGIEVVLIATSKHSPEYSVTEEDFENLAENIGAEFINDIKINSIDNINRISKLKPDIGISVNWQGLISDEVIDIFPHGLLNCHAGDLPRYRGNAVANWAILNGEKEITVTIHKMDKGLDTGDIVLQKRIPVYSDTKIGDAMISFESMVPMMFYDSVIGLCSGEIVPIMQDTDPNNALRCYPRIPSDSFIDWNQDAENINNLIRASSEPYSGAYTYLNRKKLYILRSHVEKFEVPSLYIPGQVLWKKNGTGEVGIAAKKDILVIEKVKVEDDEVILPTEVIESLRTRLGMMVQDEIQLLWNKIDEIEKILKK